MDTKMRIKVDFDHPKPKTNFSSTIQTNVGPFLLIKFEKVYGIVQ